MTIITIIQTLAFKKAYKKLHTQEKANVNGAIKDIIQAPNLGQEKKGDLASVYVYKFKILHQEMLLAYEWDPETSMLLALGVHENFYRDLSKRIQ